MKQSEKTRLTHDKIIAAAITEFGANGYAGASLNNICASGIPKGLLYHNFSGKDDLYLACVELCFNSLTAFLEAADIGSDPQKYMAARLSFFQENENEGRIFFDAILQPPEPLQDSIKSLRSGLDSFNNRIYEKILSSVTLREGVSYETALEYFTMQQAMFNGYFSSPAFRKLSFTEKMTAHETTIPRLLDFMLFGIAERESCK